MIEAIRDSVSSKAGRKEGRIRLTVYGNYLISINSLVNYEPYHYSCKGFFSNRHKCTIFILDCQPVGLHPPRGGTFSNLHKDAIQASTGAALTLASKETGKHISSLYFREIGA